MIIKYLAGNETSLSTIILFIPSQSNLLTENVKNKGNEEQTKAQVPFFQ